MTYFNEFDPFCCEWLGNLYTQAIVDTRSIHEVQPADLVGFDRVHLFAGLGGWQHALDLAGWPDNWPVWTGSCPCQPFSAAGKRQGEADERHLWPEMFRLVRECCPGIVLGEQVASKDGLGWLDGVFADLEGAGYACWATDSCAPCVGAPHIRQRLFWVAIAQDTDRRPTTKRSEEGCGRAVPQVGGCSVADGLAYTEVNGRHEGWAESDGRNTGAGCNAQRLGHAIGTGQQGCGGSVRDEPGDSPGGEPPVVAGGSGGMDDTTESGLQAFDRLASKQGTGSVVFGAPPNTTAWSDFLIIPCRDGKYRRISAQSGDEPLAASVPRDVGPLVAWLERMGFDSKGARRIIKAARRNRVGRLRGYGNAIVPTLAAEFICVVMEYLHDHR